MNRWIVLAATLSMVLAGCTAPATDEAAAERPAAQPTATTGILRGVIVNDVVQPIVNASISLLGTELAMTTNERGEFSFGGLTPDVYVLDVAATGYLPVQDVAIVKAGEDVSLKVSMPRDPAPIPYHQTYHFQGHMDVDWYYFAAVYWNALYGTVTNEEYCKCRFNVDTDATAATYVVEAVWEHWRDADTDFWWQLRSLDGQGDEQGTRPSPLYAAVPGDAYSADTTLLEAVISPVDDTDILVNQDFELFITIFYHEAAPVGWSALD